jgi:hypothetical protein
VIEDITRITLEVSIYDHNSFTHSFVLDGSREGGVDLLE